MLVWCRKAHLVGTVGGPRWWAESSSRGLGVGRMFWCTGRWNSSDRCFWALFGQRVDIRNSRYDVLKRQISTDRLKCHSWGPCQRGFWFRSFTSDWVWKWCSIRRILSVSAWESFSQEWPSYWWFGLYYHWNQSLYIFMRHSLLCCVENPLL